MDLSLVKVDLTSRDLSAAIEAVHGGTDGDHYYLCRRKTGGLFVEGVMLLPALRGLEDNSGGNGCLCVDDVARREIIPITVLDELYYICRGNCHDETDEA